MQAPSYRRGLLLLTRARETPGEVGCAQVCLPHLSCAHPPGGHLLRYAHTEATAPTESQRYQARAWLRLPEE